MIRPVELLSLSDARHELEHHLKKTNLTPWTVSRIQELTYRIHELDETENEIRTISVGSDPA